MTFLSCALTELGADALKSRRNSGVLLDSSRSILLAQLPVTWLFPSTSLHVHHQPRTLPLACAIVILSKLAFLPALLPAQLQPILCTEEILVFPQCNLVLSCVIVCEGGANIYFHSHMYYTLHMKRWNLFPLLNLGLMTWSYQQKCKWWEWYFGTFKPQGLETIFYFPSLGSQLPWKVVQAKLLDKSQIRRHHPTFCSIKWVRPYEHSSPRDLEFSSPSQVTPASNT